MATFKKMQDEVLQLIGQPNVGTTSDVRSRIKFYLNRAYLDLAYREEFEEMHAVETFQTVVGVDRYSIAATVHSIVNLRDNTNNRVLKRVDIRAYDRVVRSAGTPFRYTRWSDCLLLDPTPDAIVTLLVRFIQILPELEADADISKLTSDWDFAILLRGAELYARGTRDLAELADSFGGRFLEYIKTRRRIHSWESEDLVASITPRMR